LNQQYRYITEEEYQNLLLCKDQWHQIIEELDKVSKELYNCPYYDGSFAIDVAHEQIFDMYSEIKYRRKPWYQRVC